MASTSWALRLRELSERYGKVAVGVHFSVSALSTATIYLALKNNVDVVGLLERVGLTSNPTKKTGDDPPKSVEAVWKEAEWSDADPSSDMAKSITDGSGKQSPSPSRDKRPEAAMGALGLALICNKALFPVRVPITVVLTPPVSRFINRIKAGL